MSVVAGSVAAAARRLGLARTAVRSVVAAARPVTAAPLPWVRAQHTESAGSSADAGMPPPRVGLATPLKMHSNSATVLRTPQLVPEYWRGVNARDESTFTIDCAGYDLPSLASRLEAEGASALPQELQDRMVKTFDDEGLILLTNTGLGDEMQAMRATASLIITDGMAYEGGSNSRHEIEKNVYDTGAPKEAHLHYHHEMAYVGRSTKMVAFCCSHAKNDGTGATFVSYGLGTTDMLMGTELGHKLREKGITYIRCLTDARTGLDDSLENDESPVYNHWQQSFGVETEEEVAEAAKAKGLEIEWGENGFLKTKFTVSAFEYFAPLERNLMYAAVADDSMWFDTWPGVRHLPTMESFSECTQNDRPLKITFGDGTDFTREELQLLIDIYDEYGVKLDWNRGDIAVMCNFRWAHGRPAYDLAEGEQRTLGVILGETFKRQGQRDDKW